jgi:multisubunit Na+/H+ antiporter MnhG subunit
MYARTVAPARPRIGIFGVIYLVVGVAIAATHHYFEHLSTVKTIVSAVLAVVLWPLLLLGINLHVH